MAWRKQDQANGGQALLVDMIGGFDLGYFNAFTADDVLKACRLTAQGWEPLSVTWERGFLNFGDKRIIIGRVLPGQRVVVEQVRQQVNDAVNSFVLAGFADSLVLVSDDVATVYTPDPSNDYRGTIQLVAIAVIAVAAIWGLSEVRKLLK